MLAVAIGASGCAEPGPRPVAFGADACASCLMGVVDDGHAAEVVTSTGRVYVFDSVECLASYLAGAERPAEVHSTWVTDFSNPTELVRAEEAYFLRSPTLASPMGLGLTAFARAEDRDGAVHAFGGEAMDWSAVTSVVASRWPGGMPAHGGHSETLATPPSDARRAHGG
jgi:copper chaperone NosL